MPSCPSTGRQFCRWPVRRLWIQDVPCGEAGAAGSFLICTRWESVRVRGLNPAWRNRTREVLSVSWPSRYSARPNSTTAPRFPSSSSGSSTSSLVQRTQDPPHRHKAGQRTGNGAEAGSVGVVTYKISGCVDGSVGRFGNRKLWKCSNQVDSGRIMIWPT